MNNKLLSAFAVITALLASNPCSASEEINIFQPGGVWYLQRMDWGYQEQRLTVKGDTTLCGHECQQVWRSTNGGNETLVANIYTEGDKVYFVKADKVHLMYDFGLQPGDTTHVDLLNDERPEDNAERYVKCIERHTIQNNGHSFDVMKMGEYYYDPESHYSDNSSISEFSWIVGVGANTDPFRNRGFDVVGYQFPKLLEVKLGDEVLYDAYADKYDKYSQELVTPPASLEAYEVNCTAAYTWNAESDGLQWTAQMGIDGDDVYIQGLCADLPEAWVKGKLTGDEVVFNSQQCLGYMDLFADDDHLSGPFYFATGNLSTELVMTWDAETRTLQCPTYSYMARFMDDNYYLLDLYYNVTITPKEEESQSSAKNYFAIEGTVWNVEVNSFITGQSFHVYKLEGKETIGGHECLKYWEDDVFVFYIYTEGDKVFCIRPDAEDESLLIYDFGLNAGDKISVDIVDTGYNYEKFEPVSHQMCINVGTLSSCGHDYEYQEMYEYEESTISRKWIRGLGGDCFLGGEIANWGYSLIGSCGADLKSVVVNGETIYDKDDTIVSITDIHNETTSVTYRLDGTTAHNENNGLTIHNGRIEFRR